WHQSNAAYFLDRDPVYLKLGQRGQRPAFPIPSQPPPVLRGRLVPVSCTTEAHAHYMHELAKRVLTEAGGSQSSVVFAPIGQSPLGLMAIEVVRETWPTHLTPSEAAGLADK
ncbi:hypothetical protein TELCIR_22123, partial [Teladorsagia circumcincta]